MDPSSRPICAPHRQQLETTRPQTINIDQVLSVHFNEKKKVARRRWAILAKALKNPVDSSYGEPASPTDEYSVRRISSFMLFATTQLDGAQDPIIDAPPSNLELHYYIKEIKRRIWYRYTMCTPSNKECFVIIGHRRRTFSAEDLMGFNNTGNVCIWPSEETLSYFIGTNLHLFAGRSVLELGGGMSCLAGLICAKYANCSRVLLTDGNKISVENVQVSVACNQFRCPVSSQILRWGTPDINHCCQYDAILCADCLFFDDARADLIQSLCGYLTRDGVAYVMAPRRGVTLDSFRARAVEQGFRCLVRENYSPVVWSKHLELLEHDEYDDDIHYPVLLELTKV